jgi:predicted transcriptional regulator
MARAVRSIRLTDEARRLLALLADKLGLNHTAIIELAIRALAEREGVR